jgi:hypothetical protein
MLQALMMKKKKKKEEEEAALQKTQINAEKKKQF